MADQNHLAQTLTHSSGPISEPGKTNEEKNIDLAQESIRRWRWTTKIGEETSPTKRRRTNQLCVGANPNNNLGTN